MRRKCQNKKVIRAITIGLAAVLSVTSTPITAFAEGVDGTNGVQPSGTETTTNPQGQEEAKPTVDSASEHANYTAVAAEGTTGKLTDAPSADLENATVGSNVSAALANVASGEAAVTEGNKLYKTSSEVDNAVGKLLTNGKHSDDGTGQIEKAETAEKGQETAFGVVFEENLDADGKAVLNNRKGLDDKIDAANTAIGTANDKKDEAYAALTGENGVQDKVKTANDLIKIVEGEEGKKGKKSIADSDTTAANEAIDDKTTGKDAIDNAVSEKLATIETNLKAAVVEDNITNAVGAVSTASNEAAKIATESLTTVQDEFENAKNAADNAEANSGNYSYQQMVNLANSAQTAADNAKNAATLADQALTTLNTKETEAKKIVTDAQTALTAAQNEATKALKDYKDALDAINAKITTANDSRGEAQKAMKAANEAIDDAIALMGDTTDTSVTGAQAKIKAMNDAIKAANDAIKIVTGLKYDDKATKPEKEKHPLGAAEKTLSNVQTRLNKQTEKLAKAKDAYDSVITAQGEAAANKAKVDAAVAEIDKRINGEGNIYDAGIAAVDKDIKDLKALLSTGGQYSYSYLENRANDLANGLSQSGSELEKYVAEEGLFGGQKLTAEQIADICKVEKDEQGNSVYTDEYKALMDAAEAKTPDIVEYKNGNNELELKDADYVDSDGNIYKHEEKNVTPSLEDGYYKPGPYWNDWTTGKQVIDIKLEGDQMLIMKEVEYEHKLYTQEELKVDACENTSRSITKEEYDKFVGLNDDEKKEFAIACLCKQAGIDEVVEVKVSGKTATIKVKDPETNHTNAFIVYKINCDLEKIYADDSFAQMNYYCLNVKVNEFAETDRSRVGMFRETYAYDYTKYTRNVIPGEYTEDALKAQETLQELNGILSSYNTVLYYKNRADEQLKNANEFDINKAEGISQDDKDKYDAAVEARKRIVNAKAYANDYLKELKDKLSDLSNHILEANDGVAKYGTVNGQNGPVDTAQARITTVRKKYDALKSLYSDATNTNTNNKEKHISATSVDDKITVGDKTDSILDINNTLKSTLAELKKYNLDDYNALAYVRPELREIDVTIKSEDATTADEKKNVELLNMDYLGTVRKTLAAAIESASTLISNQNKILEGIATKKTELTKQLESIQQWAADAQKEADRAATALKNWRAPYVPGDDDDDEESSTDTGIIYTNQGVTITGLDLAAIGAGTGTGIRAVAGARTGVAGVRTEADIQNPQVPLAGSVSTNSNTTTAANGEETTANIGDNLVPLAEAPFEKGTEMNLAWLLSLAAAVAAGVGAFGYGTHRRKVAANDESKKYKK